MAKLLIVDDEASYRDQLEIIFANDGHTVRTAGGGREAIQIAIELRPDVVITDWMLRGDMHGLHIIQVLHAVFPRMACVVITGFPSQHLREVAWRTQVIDFIEKPFTLDRIRLSVKQALEKERTDTPPPSIALMEVDDRQGVTYANEKAADLLLSTPDEIVGRSLDHLFHDDIPIDLHNAVDHWVMVRPRKGYSKGILLRAKPPTDEGRGMIVLRRSGGPKYWDSNLINMLLGCQAEQGTEWPFDEHVLIVDGDPLTRQLAVSLLESVGATCYAVENCEQAIQLIDNCEKIGYVLLEYNDARENMVEHLRQIRLRNRQLVVIGTGNDDRQHDFAELGIHLFLIKPWRVGHLIELLDNQ